MTNILDHVSQASVREIDDLPRSATRKEWFAITRRIIQDTIAVMNLDPAVEAELIAASAWLAPLSATGQQKSS